MTASDLRGFESPVCIDTPRLTLRLAHVHEAAELVAFFRRNQAHLQPWEPERPPDFLTIPYWDARLVELAALEFARHSYRLHLFAKERAVCRDVGAIIGSVSLSNVQRGPLQAATLGFSLDAACEGRGLMREALEASVAFAFDTLELHRIEANHQPHNLRSARLLRRLGFEVQGYARDYLLIDGAWRDHVLTARTRPEPLR